MRISLHSEFRRVIFVGIHLKADSHRPLSFSWTAFILLIRFHYNGLPTFSCTAFILMNSFDYDGPLPFSWTAFILMDRFQGAGALAAEVCSVCDRRRRRARRVPPPPCPHRCSSLSHTHTHSLSLSLFLSRFLVHTHTLATSLFQDDNRCLLACRRCISRSTRSSAPSS